MRKRIPQFLGASISLVLFAAALGLIYSRLRHYELSDIAAEVRRIPIWAVGWAFLLTAANYLAMSLYDMLALRYIGRRLPYRRVLVASTVGFAFSNNTTVVGGGAARYRLYSAMGLTAGEVTRLVGFCAFTFWLGFLAIGGFVFVVNPPPLPAGMQGPAASTRLIGLLFVGIILAYLVLLTFHRAPLRYRTWILAMPTLRISAGQLLIGTVDFSLCRSLSLGKGPGLPLV